MNGRRDLTPGEAEAVKWLLAALDSGPEIETLISGIRTPLPEPPRRALARRLDDLGDVLVKAQKYRSREQEGS